MTVVYKRNTPLLPYTSLTHVQVQAHTNPHAHPSLLYLSLSILMCLYHFSTVCVVHSQHINLRGLLKFAFTTIHWSQEASPKIVCFDVPVPAVWRTPVGPFQYDELMIYVLLPPIGLDFCTE